MHFSIPIAALASVAVAAPLAGSGTVVATGSAYTNRTGPSGSNEPSSDINIDRRVDRPSPFVPINGTHSTGPDGHPYVPGGPRIDRPSPFAPTNSTGPGPASYLPNWDAINKPKGTNSTNSTDPGPASHWLPGSGPVLVAPGRPLLNSTIPNLPRGFLGKMLGLIIKGVGIVKSEIDKGRNGTAMAMSEMSEEQRVVALEMDGVKVECWRGRVWISVDGDEVVAGEDVEVLKGWLAAME